MVGRKEILGRGHSQIKDRKDRKWNEVSDGKERERESYLGKRGLTQEIMSSSFRFKNVIVLCVRLLLSL